MVDDVVQETFVRALGARISNRNGTVQNYLGTIAYRLAVKEARRARKDVQLEGQDLTDDGQSPLESILNSERDHFVAKAICNLSEDHRDVLVLRYYGGHRYEEIAEILEVPLGTVKSRIFNAVKNCREALRQKGVL
jgi:RNA polymerase sigma-70 factor (ECF subfamily)